MSYQVIARKWRPQTFDEVKGQGHVTAALRNAIRSDRMPHALLLSGPRGVGKTTLARLIARSLNCEKGPTDTPCGSCIPCEEITAGRSTDVQEVDAASRTRRTSSSPCLAESFKRSSLSSSNRRFDD